MLRRLTFLFTILALTIGFGQPVVVDDFETDFGNWDALFFSGSTVGLDASSSATLSTDYAYNGVSSAKFDLVDDAGVDDWFVRYQNRDDLYAADSEIGFWLRASSPTTEFRLVIWDNGTGGDGYEAGPWITATAAIDDWEWVSLDLANDAVVGWLTGNSAINSTDFVMIESIQVRDTEETNVVFYIDDVTEIPATPAVEPQDIVINEVGEPYDMPDTYNDTYVELYNTTDAAIDVSDWVLWSNQVTGLRATSSFVFPTGTSIAAGGYLVATRNRDAFLVDYGTYVDAGIVPIAASTTGSGVYIADDYSFELLDGSGTSIDATGSTLAWNSSVWEKNAPTDDGLVDENWHPTSQSSPVQGTPGAENSLAPTETTYTIVEIQTPDAGGDASQHNGELVETSGIITAKTGYSFYMQDGTADYSGIYVYINGSTSAYALGDDVTVNGTVGESNGLTRIQAITNVTINSSGNDLPAPIALITNTLAEGHEGMLVSVTGECTAVSSNAGGDHWAFKVDDGSGDALVDDQIYSDAETATTVGSDYHVVGVVNYYYGEFTVNPRDLADIVELLPAFPTHTVDFEPAGVGADWVWTVADNDDNPPLEFVANPATGGINTSATTAKFIARLTGQPWALVHTDDDGEFTFDATNSTVTIMVYKPVISNVGLKVEGGTGTATELTVANTAINTWEELTFDFSAVEGQTFGRLVLIPDFDFTPRAQENIIYFDNIQVPDGIVPPPLPEPVVAAPTPTIPEVDVVSIYSDVYTDVAGTNFNPGWGQSTVFSEVLVDGNNTLLYTGLNYQGTEFTAQDVSGMNFLHVDFWTANSTDLDFFLISPGPVEMAFELPLTLEEWVSVDIPLTAFDPVDLTNVFQFKVVGNGTIYLDNMFFHATPPPPIVANGDFEAWTANVPDAWTTIESGITITPEDNPTFVHGGMYSMETEVTTGTQGDTDFRQTVAVEADVTYDVSVWIYHADDEVQARLYCGDYRGYSNNATVGAWQELTYSYTPTTTGTVEVGLRFYDQASFDGTSTLYVDDFTMVVGVPPVPTEYSIVDIQTPDAGGDASQHVGEYVETRGTVTAIGGYFYFIQDGVSDYSGMYVYDGPGDLVLGDDVTLIGYVTEYNGLTQLTDVETTTVDSSGNVLPAPILLGTNTLTEAHESMLVTITGECTAVSTDPGTDRWAFKLNDGSGDALVDDQIYSATEDAAIVGSYYDVVGAVNYYYGAFTVNPRDLADVMELDMVSPELASIVAAGNTQLQLRYNEPVATGALTLANYSVMGDLGSETPTAVTMINETVYVLDVPPILPNEVYTVAVSGVHDLSGNAIADTASIDVVYDVPGSLPIDRIIDDFVTDVGDWTDPNHSGSTYGLLETSTFTTTDTTSFNGSNSGQLLLLDDPAEAGGWFLRLWNYNRADSIKADSKMFFYLHGGTAAMQVRIVIKDDDPGYDVTPWQDITQAEDDWQVISIDLENDVLTGWAGVGGNGIINAASGSVAIDGIQIRCSEDVSTVLFVDMVTERYNIDPVEVTFDVNMSIYTLMETFDMSTDFVDVAGNFNAWGDVPMVLDDPEADSLYTITLTDLYPGETLEYKFRINGSWSDDTAEFPFGGPARIYVVPDTNSTVFHWYNDVDEYVGTAGILIPTEYALHDNYPNPFNPITNIKYDIPENTHVTIAVYNTLGQHVIDLVNEEQAAGYYHLQWNGLNKRGTPVGSGLYFYRLTTSEFTQSEKMTYLK